MALKVESLSFTMLLATLSQLSGMPLILKKKSSISKEHNIWAFKKTPIYGRPSSWLFARVTEEFNKDLPMRNSSTVIRAPVTCVFTIRRLANPPATLPSKLKEYYLSMFIL